MRLPRSGQPQTAGTGTQAGFLIVFPPSSPSTWDEGNHFIPRVSSTCNKDTKKNAARCHVSSNGQDRLRAATCKTELVQLPGLGAVQSACSVSGTCESRKHAEHAYIQCTGSRRIDRGCEARTRQSGSHLFVLAYRRLTTDCVVHVVGLCRRRTMRR